MRKMSLEDKVRKAMGLSAFIYHLYQRRIVTRQRALYALDRIAHRVQRDETAHEAISTTYMTVEAGT